MCGRIGQLRRPLLRLTLFKVDNSSCRDWDREENSPKRENVKINRAPVLLPAFYKNYLIIRLIIRLIIDGISKKKGRQYGYSIELNRNLNPFHAVMELNLFNLPRAAYGDKSRIINNNDNRP